MDLLFSPEIWMSPVNLGWLVVPYWQFGLASVVLSAVFMYSLVTAMFRVMQ